MKIVRTTLSTSCPNNDVRHVRFQPPPDIRTPSETAVFDLFLVMSGDVRSAGHPDTPPNPLILLMFGCPGCPPPKGGYALGGHPRHWGGPKPLEGDLLAGNFAKKVLLNIDQIDLDCMIEAHSSERTILRLADALPSDQPSTVLRSRG